MPQEPQIILAYANPRSLPKPPSKPLPSAVAAAIVIAVGGILAVLLEAPLLFFVGGAGGLAWLAAAQFTRGKGSLRVRSLIAVGAIISVVGCLMMSAETPGFVFSNLFSSE